MPVDPTSPVSWIQLVERGGGWVVLVVFLWSGWRGFMVLAREFSSKVTSVLEKISMSMEAQKTEFAHLSERVGEVHQEIRALADRVHRNESDSDIVRRRNNEAS